MDDVVDSRYNKMRFQLKKVLEVCQTQYFICEKYIFPILSMFLKVKHLYKESKGWKRKEKSLNQRDSKSEKKKHYYFFSQVIKIKS